MTQLNIENSSQAIKIKIKPNTNLISKIKQLKKINLRELSPKKHLSDSGEKCLSDLSGNCQGELGGN